MFFFYQRVKQYKTWLLSWDDQSLRSGVSWIREGQYGQSAMWRCSSLGGASGAAGRNMMVEVHQGAGPAGFASRAANKSQKESIDIEWVIDIYWVWRCEDWPEVKWIYKWSFFFSSSITPTSLWWRVQLRTFAVADVGIIWAQFIRFTWKVWQSLSPSLVPKWDLKKSMYQKCSGSFN